MAVITAVLFCRKRTKSNLLAKYGNDNDNDNDSISSFSNGDDVQLLDLGSGSGSSSSSSGSAPAILLTSAHGVQSEAAAESGLTAAMQPKSRRSRSSKFIAPVIRLGRATQAARGLPDLMGYTNMSIVQHIMSTGGGVDAIISEIMWNGTEEDKANLNGILDGTYRTNHGDASPEELAAQSKTVEELMQTDEVKSSGMQLVHVLALRLYTTSTYASVNAPMRTTPPTKPHPFAVTAYYISQGIKMLRSVAGELPGAHQPQVFWRGMKDLTISDAFMESGGTEFACMSTTLVQDVAVDFAFSRAPMLLKLETKDFMSRGADITFLSVYPGESETLFPPLTFLRPIARETVAIKGKQYLLVRCEPVIP